MNRIQGSTKMSKLRSLGQSADLTPLAAAGWQAETAMRASSNLTSETGVALTGHAIITTVPEDSGATNQSSVDALAVNTAVTDYLAETGSDLDGAGLKIGILSDSFNLNGGEAAAIADGDLPAASDIHILQEGTSGADEGMALAELIHSIAPDAQLYFYSGTTSEAGMAAGINTLTSLGMNVIVDDITYTDEPFYQDTGVVTKAVEAAIAAGVSYFTSAGNDSNNYYEAAFSPMVFNLPGIGTVNANDVSGGSPYEAVQLGTDPTLDLTMQWTQPFGANQYDIGVGLYSYNSATGYTLIQDFTTSTLGGDPILSIYTTLGLIDGTYYLAFYESGSDLVNGLPVTPGTFKILAFQDSNVTFDGVGSGTGSGASIGHELVPGVNTIAAVNVTQTPNDGVTVPVTEPYSSAGGGETYINAAGATLATPINDGSPDFAATDGSPTSVFNPFDGTSAAAASAAAVGLLVLQADASLTPAQVSYLLKISAIPTADSITGGAGLIQASTAVNDALTAHTTPIWTGQGDTALWGTAANWSDAAVPTAGTAVEITDGVGVLTGAYVTDFNVASASIGSLEVAGGTITGAVPDLMISAGDDLTTGSLTLGIGTINVAGTLSDTGNVALAPSGIPGLIDIDSTGAVSIAGSAVVRQVDFVGTGGTLIFGATNALTLTQALAAPIANFQAGDVVDLRGLAESSVASIVVVGSEVKLLNSSGKALADLTVSGATSGLGFTADSTGGTELVAGAAANFENLDVAGKTGPQTVTVGAATTGLLELTNSSTVGTSGTATTTAGLANVSVTVPAGYNQLIVTAPGSETVTGNGSDDFSATFGANSTVTFNSNGGSGTITALGPALINLTDGGPQSSTAVENAAAGSATVSAAASTFGAASIGFISNSTPAALAGSGNPTLSGAAAANTTITGAVSQKVFGKAANGGGAHAISSHINANLNASLSAAAVPDFNTLAAAPNGSILHLSDQTTIQLYGVKSTSLNTSIPGGAHV